jgi:ATP-binding cassette subfamily B protein
LTRRFIAAEVVQTSAMDCGPASLKCLLEGYGISVSYGRLREACQTDVDGTSIDTMEEIGRSLGLDCEQVMLPLDHLLLREADAFPAIIVVRLPSGFTHFVVAWRRLGSAVQLMDPIRGRYWTSGKRFLEDIYSHTIAIPAATFREWAGSDEFAAALAARLRQLGCAGKCDAEIEAARADPGWRSLAKLDGAVRMAAALVHAGGLRRGRESGTMIASLFRRAVENEGILDAYLTARPAPHGDGDEGEETLLLRGAVLVRAKGPIASSASSEARPALSPELVAALNEAPAGAGRHLLSLLGADGALALPVIALSLLGAVTATAIEAVLFRSAFDLGRILGLVQHRMAAMAALTALALILFALEVPIAGSVTGLGRRLEVRLRLAFFGKIPRLGDRYFRSRPTSDMAERCHAIHDVRLLPDLGAQVVRIVLDLVVTALAIAWVDAKSAPFAAAAVLVAIAVPLAAQPAVIGRDLRARTHLGAVARFYLDALQGLAPIRTHGAENAVRREHEALLVEWTRAAFEIAAASVTIEAVQMVGTYTLIVLMLLSNFARASEPAAVLLLLYWALNLPLLGRELATLLRQYPTQRNRTLRLLEPLGATEGEGDDVSPPTESRNAVEETHTGERFRVGVSLVFEQVRVVAAGHTILEGLDLWIDAGAHVAIVGASGSGKSSFLGTLLGWHRPGAGRILVDGKVLDAAELTALRRQTAWVDPAVHLWNRSLKNNLCYGQDGAPTSLAPILEASELLELLETLPDGLQTSLGEGGALVSGGEGQRARLGRALLRADARLVLLDEPFRGLDRERRHRLIARARSWWSGATLLCVTHDIAETRAFDRVLVVDDGHIVEDGHPDALATQTGSRYAGMLSEEEDLKKRAWSASVWRRVFLSAGRLRA